ncbi:deoxyribonuclease V [Paenibacillus massiliensis]|uniref:deoxyribonuclease V n=1 Tax=Paenibacillus massiliensis TaxID=225917 RepID=UPI00048BFF4A|nr:deoxyribonuclease V [Paenibacillus massiliensis]
MEPKFIHPWDVNEAQSIEIQQELAKKVIQTDQLSGIYYIAGVDVAYHKSSDQLVAAVVILEKDSLECIETSVIEDTAQFPYIPGLFSFRELPPIIKAFEKIQHTPQLIVCDGQGVAHPRRCGLASHLGVLFDVPTIGCGKTRLWGEYSEPDIWRGSTAPLIDDDEVIGNVLRTQDKVNPVFISVGHRISLDTACQWILDLAPKYRLPETTRQADQLVKKHCSAI